MFLELIGNDVCKKSFDSMTKPADFKRDAIRLLNYIDSRVNSVLFRYLQAVIWSF